MTQVVPPQVEYQFHDRLSHSVKVAQVAASLARQLVHEARERRLIPEGVLSEIDAWIHPDYCFAAGLAHDLGHPPFGHAGEVALQRFCEGFEVPVQGDDGDVVAERFERVRRRSFEGNAQSTRLVAELSFRKGYEQPGLDLTLRTLAAIAKYPWLRNNHPIHFPKLQKKWSFYEEESPILESLEEREFIRVEIVEDQVHQVHRWVEAEVMDWADDISYATHDLEDFFRAGLIPLHQIGQAFSAAPASVDWLSTDFDFVNDDDIRACLQFTHRKLSQIAQSEATRIGLLDDLADAPSPDDLLARAFKVLIDDLSPHLPLSPFSGSRESHAALQRFSSALIRRLTSAGSLIYLERTGRIQLMIDPAAVLVAEFFKSLNKLFVIESAMLSTAQYGQSADIDLLCESLFDVAVVWLESFDRQRGSRTLPPRLHAYLVSPEGYANEGDDANFVLTRVIDYVCSLSDVQATKLAQQLKGSSEAGVLAGRWLDF